MHLVDLRTSEAQMYLNFAKGLSSLWHLTGYSELTVIGEHSKRCYKSKAQLKHALFLLSSQLGVNVLTRERRNEESVAL